MQNIEKLPHDFDRSKRECQAIVETPRGRRNKFKYEPDAGLFTLSRVLPAGFSFPFDFGFIPSTGAEDGDPLDVIVLMDEPAHVGCILKIRLIGVIQIVQTENGKQTQNDRLIGVAVQSFAYREIRSLEDLRESFLEQVTEFMALYNKNSGKQDDVKGLGGPERAIALLEKSIRAFKAQSRKSKQ